MYSPVRSSTSSMLTISLKRRSKRRSGSNKGGGLCHSSLSTSHSHAHISPREMEDNFKVRVEKLFGSDLFQSVPKSSFPTSSWSVTDGEVEKKEWNRERGVDPDREENPCVSAYYDESGCLKKKNWRGRGKLLDVDFDDQDDLDDEEVGRGREKIEEDEERDIRDSIGLDPTLDYEEEEDEFDRAAILKEKLDDRVYMSDITDHGPYINYHSVVAELQEDSSEAVRGSEKDPRADHLAASIRLREDEAASGSMDHLTSNGDIAMSASQVTMMPTNLKPILKRKEHHEETRPKKHVRFNSVDQVDQNKDSAEPADSLEIQKMVPEPSNAIIIPTSSNPEYSPGIPDYVRNPSKYVRYSFSATDDMDNSRNQQAFAELQSMLMKSRPAELEAGSMELPKSVKFTPRKKTTDAASTGSDKEDPCRDTNNEVLRSVGIAVEAQASEACDMDMEEHNSEPPVEEKRGLPRKGDRKYRQRASLDDSAS